MIRTRLLSAAAVALLAALAPLSAACATEPQASQKAERPVITATAAGQTIRIRLADTPEARQFEKMLPASALMGEYGGREFYGPSPRPIAVSSQGQYEFEDGTLTYCPTNDTIAIFYAQSPQPRLTMAVYPMGRVISDLSVFRKLPGRARFEFRK